MGTNVPRYCIEEVALHTVSFILNFARGITHYNSSVSTGEWKRDVVAPLHRFSAQTVGIVGFGDIGRAVARRLDAFDVTILAYDPFLTADDIADEPASLVAFETLLSRANYVSIHSPLNEETREMFDLEVFDTTKPTATLINVARGPIVDETALISALETNTIAAAGLDVTDPEPPDEDSPLRSHPQVVLSPHVAWYPEEANAERRCTAANCVRAVLTDSPRNVVVNSNGSRQQ